MVKTYLRYIHEEAFGVIASPRSATVSEPSGKFAYSPGIHEVLVWDLKRGELAKFMTPDGEDYLKGEVTSLLAVGDGLLAVGYSTGMVRCFDTVKGGAPTVSLMGHKGAVACLANDASCMHLASGGNDTDVVVWDVVAERGLCRLRGHKDAVTALRFLAPSSASVAAARSIEGNPAGSLAAGSQGSSLKASGPRLLVSSSKDALVKVRARSPPPQQTHPTMDDPDG
jgi:U3 small nucleolar RNA-associated protein 12